MGSYSTEQQSRAEIAYNAYCEATGGVSLISGDKLPEFATLKDTIKAAWAHAADAVVASLVSK